MFWEASISAYSSHMHLHERRLFDESHFTNGQIKTQVVMFNRLLYSWAE